jgi:hypothetical protein
MNIRQQSADQVTSDKSNGAHEMTQESRAQRRARERAHKHSIASHDMQQQVAHRRASRKNIPHGERHAQQQWSNAKFSANQTTPDRRFNVHLTTILIVFVEVAGVNSR